MSRTDLGLCSRRAERSRAECSLEVRRRFTHPPSCQRQRLLPVTTSRWPVPTSAFFCSAQIMTGSDQYEDLATLGSVQLKQTLASRLPGERPLVEMNGAILIVDTAMLQWSTLWKKTNNERISMEFGGGIVTATDRWTDYIFGETVSGTRVDCLFHWQPAFFW